jgi:hypothetical protein
VNIVLKFILKCTNVALEILLEFGMRYPCQSLILTSVAYLFDVKFIFYEFKLLNMKFFLLLLFGCILYIANIIVYIIYYILCTIYYI